MKFNMFVVCKDEDDCELWHCDQPMAFGLNEKGARYIESRVNNHERLVELLAQCSTELAESIEGKYQGILGYPSTDRDYRTDMAIVEEARTLLSALEAEKGGEL